MAQIDLKSLEKKMNDLFIKRVKALLTEEEFKQISFSKTSDGKPLATGPKEIIEKIKF